MPLARRPSDSMLCHSGRHAWLDPEDRARCCNGWERVLVVGDTRHCDRVAPEPLPGGIRYGYAWRRVEKERP
jgi:hypothetical protein